MELPDALLPWAPTWILPVADVQFGAPGSDTGSFRRYIEWGLAAEERGITVRFISLGDLLDWVRPTMRQRLRMADLDPELVRKFEEPMQDSIQEFLHLVRGTKGKWLGLVRGHHLYDFFDGTNTDSRIAAELGAPYWGDSALLTLHFQRPKSAQRFTADIFMAHGCGSSVSPWGPLLKLNRDIQPGWDADFYVIGHYTKRPSVPLEWMYKTRHNPPRLGVRLRWLVGAGGWLRGYMAGSREGMLPGGSYVEKGLMRPVSIGGAVLKITPRHNSREGDCIKTWAGASGEEVDL